MCSAVWIHRTYGYEDPTGVPAMGKSPALPADTYLRRPRAMKATGIRITLGMLTGAAMLCLAGCANTVTIHYDQVATCYVFDSNPTGSPHTATQSGNGLFVIYKIKSIDNTSSGAKDFNF